MGEEQGCSIDIFFLTGLFVVSFDSDRFLFVCRNGFFATSCRSGSGQFANLRFLISNCSQLFCFVTARVIFRSIVFGVCVRRDGPGCSFKASTLADSAFVLRVSVRLTDSSRIDAALQALVPSLYAFSAKI